ncbi:MAG: DMT family transporter [Chloroflexi bacterium]|nr:DMT family transporter [Chloroflexota bacterium]
MIDMLPLILIGVLGGVAVGLQTPFAGAISQRVGGAASSLIIHASGAVVSAIVLFARGGEHMGQWRELPWYLWGAGGLGVILYLTLSVTFPRLGATATIVLVILGQLLSGLVIDHFGLLGVNIRAIDGGRVLGAVVVLVGAYLILRQT